MPAVGKSTVGQLLSQKTGFDFIDTDLLIQEGENKTLAQIIAAQGLESFLEIEARYLLGLKCNRNIIATGGSAVYKRKAMEHLLQNSLAVYLEIGLNELTTRLSDLESRGVAIGPDQNVMDLYQERIRLYERYHDVMIHCGLLPPHKIADRILETLSRYQGFLSV